MRTSLMCFALVCALAQSPPAFAQALTPVGAVTGALAGGGLYGGDSAAVIAVLKQQTTTFPIGTSSGGFTWTFDRLLGIAVRQSDSFGPIFADRPFTIGRGSLSVGLTTQHTAWKSLAGQSLPDGGVYAQYLYSDDLYTRQVLPVQELYRTSLDLQTDRTAISAVYGVTARLDLAVIVPFGRTSVVATDESYYQIIPTAAFHQEEKFSYAAAASGMADMTIRAKYLAFSSGHLALAASGDLRLPTGDVDKLLGVGKAQESISVLGSWSMSRLAPHFEAGYVNGGAGLTFKPPRSDGVAVLATAEPSDEIRYTVGADSALSKRLTIAGDVLGRTLKASAKVVRTVTTSAVQETTLFKSIPGSVTLVLGTVGAKFAFGSSWLLTGGVLFPLNDQGVKPGITPVIGFERAF